MNVFKSGDLKDSLDENEIVTAEDLQVCLKWPSKTIETACGPVEYAARGEGPAVLCCHGGPGGYDQALIVGELFRKNGYKVLAPSRPGYLGTPLRFGKTAEEQGDFMAAFLDALNVSEAVVVSVSGGGPAGYQIAQRHPEKVKALVVIDGISMNYTKGDDINKVEEWMYLTRTGQWLVGFFFKHFPAAAVKSFLQTESTLEKHEMGKRAKEIVSDGNKFGFIDAMFKTMTHRFPERREGADNDLAFGSAIDRLPLDRINAATLIIHGDADNDVPPRDAEYAFKAISGSQLLWIEKASHVGFWMAEDAYRVQKYTLDWLERL